jgi:hypothetical protein
MPRDNRVDALIQKVTSLTAEVQDLNDRAPKDGWFKRNGWISLVIPLVGLLVGGGLLTNYARLAINEQIDQKLKQPTADIQKLRVDVERMLVKVELREQAALDPQAFNRELGNVSETLKAASEQRVAAPSGVVESIQAKLSAASPETPGYWPAVSQFITYRSGDDARTLPSCLSRLPKIELAEPVGADDTIIKVTIPTYEDCEIDLGAALPPELVTELRSNPLTNQELIFKRARIIYRGGQIPLLTATTKLTFIDCLFAVSAPAMPPKQESALMARLLSAMDVARIVVDAAGG